MCCCGRKESSAGKVQCGAVAHVACLPKLVRKEHEIGDSLSRSESRADITQKSQPINITS